MKNQLLLLMKKIVPMVLSFIFAFTVVYGQEIERRVYSENDVILQMPSNTLNPQSSDAGVKAIENGNSKTTTNVAPAVRMQPKALLLE